MIATFLIAHRWLTTVALAVLVVAAPFAARWSARRPRVALVSAGLMLVPVAGLTLSPTRTRGTGSCTVQWVAPTGFGSVELVANLILFVLPALFATAATRRSLPVVLAGSAVSAAIELTQALVPALGRACDTNDWLYNTLGAVLGVVLAQVGLLGGRRVRPRRVLAARRESAARAR